MTNVSVLSATVTRARSALLESSSSVMAVAPNSKADDWGGPSRGKNPTNVRWFLILGNFSRTRHAGVGQMVPGATLPVGFEEKAAH